MFRPAQDHLSQCSRTLVECPNRCTAYVQRSLLDDHLQLCPKSPANSTQSLLDQTPATTSTGAPASPTIATTSALFDRLHLLDHDLHRVRDALNEETRQRHKLIVDVGALRRRNAVEDEWTQKVGDVLAALKRCLGEESSARSTDVQQLRDDVAALHSSYADTAAWRLSVRAQLDRLERDMLPEASDDGAEPEAVRGGGGGSSWRTYIDVLMTDQRATAMRVFELENEVRVRHIRRAVCLVLITCYHHTHAQVRLLHQSSADARRLAVTNEALIAERCSHLDELVAASQQPPSALNGRTSMPESTGRLARLDFEVQSLKHICTGAEDKCDRIDGIVHEVRQLAGRTAQLVAERTDQERLQGQLAAIQSVDGHLVWRIGDFAQKWQAAKDGVVTELHSPLFSDRRYGYTLRLDVHLNGMGTWRGRNVLACLSVVAGGEWDALLAWPCKLRAELRLREHPPAATAAANGTAAAGDVCKTIVAKGSADVNEQAQYIFITHKQLKRGAYVRDDAIFFEVRVRQEGEQVPNGEEQKK